MPRRVPTPWMPAGPMKRIITHWTAGGHHSSDAEEEHYHLLIEGDGTLVRGEHAITDNLNTNDGDYAAHTRACNGASIGVSLCCMAGAIQKPFRAGSAPMTQAQYAALAEVVADLCEHYNIPVSAQTVLGHGEVQANLGIKQNGKWDPMVLPWAPGLSISQVGDQFRDRVKQLMSAPATVSGAAPVSVVIAGVTVATDGIILNDSGWCPLRPLCEQQGWEILAIDEGAAQVRTPKGDRLLIATIRGSRGYVKISDLCAKMDWPDRKWDPASRTVTITPPA